MTSLAQARSESYLINALWSQYSLGKLLPMQS
jgi:hypothetical protein